MNQELDNLVTALKTQNSRESMTALWRYTLAMDEWYFIARGEMPDVKPFVGVVEGAPSLMAFTDTDYANAFGRSQNLIDADNNVSVLSIPTEGFLDYAETLVERGIENLIFNAGVHDYFQPLQNLRAIFDYINSEQSS